MINLVSFSGGLSLNTQMSLSEAADAILGSNDNGSTGGKAICSDTSPGAVAKNLLGKITMRKASILSVSSIGSFVEKKSCSSTEELYPGRSKFTKCPKKGRISTCSKVPKNAENTQHIHFFATRGKSADIYLIFCSKFS